MTTIDNPFKRGQTVTIPRGTKVRHRGRVKATKRATTVRFSMTTPGWVNTTEPKEGFGFVHLPTITWAGSGGYWSDVKVTPELCDVAGMLHPTIPELDERVYRLETIPSFGPGYDDRDFFPM